MDNNYSAPTQTTTVRAISYGFFSYLGLTFLGAVLVTMFAYLYQIKFGSSPNGVASLVQSKSFFYWVNAPGFFAAITGGYVCARHTQKKRYRNTFFLWILILLLGIISYSQTSERLFIIVTTLAGVLIGAGYFSKRSGTTTPA